MSMTKLGNLVFSSGKTGNKNHWVKSGALYQRPDGSFAVKLDQLPIGFDGWFSVFPEENAATHNPYHNQIQQHQHVHTQMQQPTQHQQHSQAAQQPASIESLSAEQIRQLLLQRLQQ